MSQVSDIKYNSSFEIFINIDSPIHISYHMQVFLPNVEYYINEEEAKEKIVDYLNSIFKLKEENNEKENKKSEFSIKPSKFNLKISRDNLYSNVYNILLTIFLDTMKGHAYGFSMIDTIKENIKYAFEKYLLSNLIKNIHLQTISGINLKLTSLNEYIETDYIVLEEQKKNIPLV